MCLSFGCDEVQMSSHVVPATPLLARCPPALLAGALLMTQGRDIVSGRIKLPNQTVFSLLEWRIVCYCTVLKRSDQQLSIRSS